MRKPAARAFLFMEVLSTQYPVLSVQGRDRGVGSHLSRINERAVRNHNVLSTRSSGTVGPDAFCPEPQEEISAAELPTLMNNEE